MLHYSPPSKKTRVRQVAFDKWLPLNLANSSQLGDGSHVSPNCKVAGPCQGVLATGRPVSRGSALGSKLHSEALAHVSCAADPRSRNAFNHECKRVKHSLWSLGSQIIHRVQRREGRPSPRKTTWPLSPPSLSPGMGRPSDKRHDEGEALVQSAQSFLQGARSSVPQRSALNCDLYEQFPNHPNPNKSCSEPTQPHMLLNVLFKCFQVPVPVVR